MILTREMIKEATQCKCKSSSDFEKLSFYDELMNTIDKEYSNDEIEAVQWIYQELARNIEYKTISKRLIRRYTIEVRLEKYDRKNHIVMTIGEQYLLLLDDGSYKSKGYRHSSAKEGYGCIPFYMGKVDTIKEVFKEFDILADKFDINNRAEAIKEIERLTKCKRIELEID